MSSQPLREAAETSKAWPFEEARKLIARLQRSQRKEVIFETGYGPSGLPHIGTFGEVARTSMVRHAFGVLTGGSVKTRLIAFSDDMDGLRKVPDNIPNRDLVLPHLGKPLTQVPDPRHTSLHHTTTTPPLLDRLAPTRTIMSSSSRAVFGYTRDDHGQRQGRTVSFVPDEIASGTASRAVVDSV